MNSGALARRIRQHVNAPGHEFYAVVHPGFETAAASELEELGICGPRLEGTGGVGFSGRLEACWRAHIGSRTVSRILMRLDEFRARDWQELIKKAARMPWELWLPVDSPLELKISTRKTRLNHEGRIAAEIGRAIGERRRRFDLETRFRSPGQEEGGDSQAVYVRLDDDRCQISLDASGELLYRRGWERHVGPAPLRETLAAAILRSARIGEYQALLDPMAGSGVFSTEAGMMAAAMLPGGRREYSFQRWPAHRQPAYRHLLQAMQKEIQPIPLRSIQMGDIDEKALTTARHNLEIAGLTGLIEVRQNDFLDSPPRPSPGLRTLLVLNPPYGGRLQSDGSIRSLYSRLGKILRSRFNDCGWAVVVPGLSLEKALAIPHEVKIPFFNGGFPVALLVRHAPRSLSSGERSGG